MQDFVPSDSKYELQVQYCSEGAAKPSSCSNIGTKYAASKKSMDAKQFKSSPYLVDVPSGVVCQDLTAVRGGLGAASGGAAIVAFLLSAW